MDFETITVKEIKQFDKIKLPKQRKWRDVHLAHNLKKTNEVILIFPNCRQWVLHQDLTVQRMIPSTTQYITK